MTGKERADETFRSKESRKKADDLYPLFSLGTGGGMPGDLRLCPAVEQKSNGARPDIPPFQEQGFHHRACGAPKRKKNSRYKMRKRWPGL